MRLLFCGTGWLDIVPRIRRRLPPGATLDVRDPETPLAAQVAGYDVLLPSNGRVDAEVVAAATALRLIQQPAAGYEGIDVAAARARGVPVCNAPGQNAEAVAEHALLLMLMLARRVPRARRVFAERGLGVPAGRELAGRALGVVGLGRTGSHLARVAEGLGMEVRGVRSRDGRERLLEMARSSDVLSVHCPLTEATRGLVGAEVLEALPAGAFVVSCARGGVVDEEALLAALASGHLGGAGLDVHAAEPPDPASPLYAREDVVATPHVAGSTEEAFDRIAAVVGENVARVARGEAPRFRVDT